MTQRSAAQRVGLTIMQITDETGGAGVALPHGRLVAHWLHRTDTTCVPTHCAYLHTDTAPTGDLLSPLLSALLQKRLHDTVKDITEKRPAVLVTIDSKGFSARLRKEVRNGARHAP